MSIMIELNKKRTQCALHLSGIPSFIINPTKQTNEWQHYYKHKACSCGERNKQKYTK